MDFFSSVITCVALAPPGSLCLHRLLPRSFFGRALAGLYKIVQACVSHYKGRFEILFGPRWIPLKKIRKKWRAGGYPPFPSLFFPPKNRSNTFCSLFLKHFFFKNILRRTVFEPFPYFVQNVANFNKPIAAPAICSASCALLTLYSPAPSYWSCHLKMERLFDHF